MATREQLLAVLLGDDFTDAEKTVVIWQFGLTGDFQKALWEAIVKADDLYLLKLSFGFPEEVAGYLAWTRGDLGRRLQAAGLEI